MNCEPGTQVIERAVGIKMPQWKPIELMLQVVLEAWDVLDVFFCLYLWWDQVNPF